MRIGLQHGSQRLARTVMMPLFLALMLALVALAGCGSTPANEVDMGIAEFRQSSVSIKAGQAVHFVDPASGSTHVICVGQDLHCVPQAGAPAELSTANGMTFETGDTRDIIFATAGTYHIICTIHPGMEVDVTVT